MDSTKHSSVTPTTAVRIGNSLKNLFVRESTSENTMIKRIVSPEIGQCVPAFGAPCMNSASPISMMTGPITTGESSRRRTPMRPL